MRPFRLLLITCFILPVLLLSGTDLTVGARAPNEPASNRDLATLQDRGLPLLFVEGHDPATGKARFQVRGLSAAVWLQDGAIWITLAPRPEASPQVLRSLPHPADGDADNQSQPGVHLKLSFVGATTELQAQPFGRQETRVNTIHGAERQANQTAWAGVRYPHLYPGIDLVITGKHGRLYPYLVASPHANLQPSWADVRLRVEGANELALDENILRLSTVAGEYVLPLFPVFHKDGAIYDGDLPTPGYSGRQIVNAPFATGRLESGPSNPQQYDIFYSTFLDGSGISIGYDIAVEPSTGITYIAGATTASDFPTTPGAFDPFHNGQWDGFVVQLGSQGDSIGFATFIGGDRDDFAHAIALDQSGFIYVAGETLSSDFPTTEGAYDREPNGSEDIFVLKLNPQGSALVYSTLVGGNDSDVPWSVAVDAVGQAFVAGSTLSDPFPTTAGALQKTYGGNRDAFVLKLQADGSDLIYSTYLGGNGIEEILGLELAPGVAGGAFAVVAGATSSLDFPTTLGAFDTERNGPDDAFLARLDASGSNLIFSTFLGGSGSEGAYGLALDGAGFHYISGHTSSPDFPSTPGAYDRALDGVSDSFAARISPDGSALGYATFLGGSSGESKTYIAVDDVGMAYVTGETLSSDFPVTASGTGNRNCGSYDAYALRLNATGSALSFAMVLGGGANDYPIRAAVDNSNQAVYYGGYTESYDFPTTPDAYDSEGGGWTSAIVVKLALPIAFNGQIGAQGGTLNFGNATYQFGPGTYTSDAFIIHAPLPDNPTLVVCGAPTAAPFTAPQHAAGDGNIIVGEPFDVTAVSATSRQAVQPLQPYTMTVSYNPSDVTGVVEESLTLYRWDGEQWLPEPGSVLDLQTRTVTASPDALGTWALRAQVLEPAHTLYLPILLESNAN